MKVCTVPNINYITAVPLTLTNVWYSDLFDADGIITVSFILHHQQLLFKSLINI